MNKKQLFILLLTGIVLAFISVWLVPSFSKKATDDVPATAKIDKETLDKHGFPEIKEPICRNLKSKILKRWRTEQVIDDVAISASTLCDPDNPSEIAAFVKGTNNVSMGTLMKTRLAMDAVVKKDDKDGDGDPDVIHIKLEVIELNGSSPDGDFFFPTYEIAPGIQPGLWIFSPKSRGMSAKHLLTDEANRLLRAPSPVIRVEQGDIVKITLENTHILPHSVHLHGVDHPYVDEQGQVNDGVPLTDQDLVLPGESRTYTIKPRQAGTMFYHCHVQTAKHLMMGLQGMFVVEENKADNWLQTFNIGAGQVRHSSVSVSEQYDREYDLHYQSIDKELNAIIQSANDPRIIAQAMNRSYDFTDGTIDYFLLNGRSFPYTLRESLLVVQPDEKIKLRIVNGQSTLMALHIHGHKATITAFDGVTLVPNAQITRDVYDIAPAQRVDLRLETTDDGLHSFGSGIWLFHDHVETGITSDGMSPGGDIGLLVYESYLNANGIPKLKEESLAPFFDKRYYQKKIPVWDNSREPVLLGQAGSVIPSAYKIVSFSLIIGFLAGLFFLCLKLWQGQQVGLRSSK